MTDTPDRFYVTTPIYYVNDRPHIGHVYSTTIADVVARYHRLRGDQTFMLTGVDEHAAKVVTAAEERGLDPQSWADQNAAAFQETFFSLGVSNDDFIRTSEPRHKERVTEYVTALIENGDVYAGEYEGWYDAGQEEYISENKAKESDYLSPINGKPLTKKRERNYFFRLSAYQDRLLALIEGGGFVVEPEARRNEVVARIREGLNDVAISRTGTGGWGIPIPNDPDQTIYVWIDALFNYLSAVDVDGRREYWPADLHLIGKEILWFHAVIWPALLLGLGRELPRRVYAHSFWISEGRKMSKSLGNFVDLERLDDYVARFSLDALRYFLTTQGPIGTNDADFAEAKFLEVYNADLANTLGNSFSRVTNMIGRYCDGLVPQPGGGSDSGLQEKAVATLEDYRAAMASLRLDHAAAAAVELVRQVDGYIERTQPYRLAKEEGKMAAVGAILYDCAEAIRIASLLLWPILPDRMATAWGRLGCDSYAHATASRGAGQLEEWARWGGLQPGTPVSKGDPLFPRVLAEPAPAA
ncbi:MAG: methionine--tRNA ligase [Gemmatimonadetes bacterium]|nr:methionine--tRNA ligase [Gemmatimonadota bacterium]